MDEITKHRRTIPAASIQKDQLNELADRLADGSITPIDAAAELRALAVAADRAPTRGRGRPAGSRTRTETTSMMRAKEFFNGLDRGLSIRDAKRSVARKWTDVDPKTIYTDVRRHGPRLLENEWSDLYYTTGKRFVEQYPDCAELIIEPVRDFYPSLANRVRALGNARAADAVLTMPPIEESREFVEFLGKWFLDIRDRL